MSRTFVVSDVHGHLADLRVCLLHGGLIDDDDRWLGGPDGDAVLWVLGDMVDRGPDGIGVIRLVRSLQGQAPHAVRVLMGNHEALMLGEKLFPRSRFAEVWLINGGHDVDQEALTDDDVAWLRGLPVVARHDDFLLMHSDTTGYLTWGTTIEEINTTVAALVAGDDEEEHFDVFAMLTSRYDFVRSDGGEAARTVLDALGGECIVHGHSIIGSLVNRPSAEIEGPLTYAEGLAVAVDGGRYDGGPLLLVELGAS